MWLKKKKKKTTTTTTIEKQFKKIKLKRYAYINQISNITNCRDKDPKLYIRS